MGSISRRAVRNDRVALQFRAYSHESHHRRHWHIVHSQGLASFREIADALEREGYGLQNLESPGQRAMLATLLRSISGYVRFAEHLVREKRWRTAARTHLLLGVAAVHEPLTTHSFTLEVVKIYIEGDCSVASEDFSRPPIINQAPRRGTAPGPRRVGPAQRGVLGGGARVLAHLPYLLVQSWIVSGLSGERAIYISMHSMSLIWLSVCHREPDLPQADSDSCRR